MGKKTEYKRQFREPSQVMQKEYQNNVQYCLSRRQQEHSHFFVEWDWDSESENGRGRVLDSESEYGQGHVLRTPVRNSNNSNYGGNTPGEMLGEVPGIFRDGRQEKEAQTPDWPRRDGSMEDVQQAHAEPVHRLDQPLMKQSAQSAKKSSEKRRSGSAKKRRTKPSPSPESGGKSKKMDPKPPFLAFGWADQAERVGNKTTYNIRAANEVHPAAMRAFKRRELDIVRGEERQKRETLKKKRMRALFNSPSRQADDDVWLTEYQRNFSGRTPSG